MPEEKSTFRAGQILKVTGPGAKSICPSGRHVKVSSVEDDGQTLYLQDRTGSVSCYRLGAASNIELTVTKLTGFPPSEKS